MKTTISQSAETKDFTIEYIKSLYEKGKIITQPDYQRDYVYDDKKASKLVESALLGIPIPAIYLCEELDGKYSVIDGQQRITSFVRFLRNEFALKKLEEYSELNGKYFKDLGTSLQNSLENVSIRTNILQSQFADWKYEIFARLNQGAISLTPQELRNCVYRGSFNNFLEDYVDKNKQFLKTMFKSINKRKKYQELILRFFALSDFASYGSSMIKTMNEYMKKHQNDGPKEIGTCEKKFKNTLESVKAILGESAFTVYDKQNNCFSNKFSGSVFDSIMIAFSMFDKHDLIAHADEIRKKVNDIRMNDIDYFESTYASTGSKENVKRRIMIIYFALSEILGVVSSAPQARFFKKEDKQKLWHDHYICAECKQEILSIDDAEIDHIVPYSKNGKTTLDNAQLLHKHCNRVKSNKESKYNVEFEEE